MAVTLCAIAALAWPVVAFVFVWRFKAELAGVLARVRKVELPGGSLELDPALDELQERTSAAEQAVPDQPLVIGPEHATAGQPGAADPAEDAMAALRRPQSPADEAGVISPPAADGRVDVCVWTFERSAVDPIRREVLSEAAVSPKAGLMVLASELERQLRELAAVQGGVYDRAAEARPGQSILRQPVRRLAERVGLAPELQSALDDFQRVRNLIVHGRNADPDEVLRAIDLGLSILGAVARTPRHMNFVAEPQVELFEDEEATRPIEGWHGVVLEASSTQSPNERELRVFPTTRTHHRRGEPVAWEWNMARICPEAWWRDPGTQHVFYGWTQSAEFIGTHLSDL